MNRNSKKLNNEEYVPVSVLMSAVYWGRILEAAVTLNTINTTQFTKKISKLFLCVKSVISLINTFIILQF
jgi:hypothetical protein